ncbi:MAG: prepilin-type N-terminal cleavage/methylation domain-containing protein [Verrucomicrobia bacterium]|nr:prepilin-type N-terminal cleavage/methylation domain-containing protein [Verrucomicrobiota bacterium]
MGKSRAKRCYGFSLVEVLVASAILGVLVILLSSATGSLLNTLRNAHSKIDQYSAARAGFEQILSTLSQATLNTYWDYDNPANPNNYVRKSDLHLLIAPSTMGHAVFFQAPLSRNGNTTSSGLLNAVGFWVDFGSDSQWKPGHVPEQFRFRLMQGIQPADSLQVFTTTDGSWTNAVKTIPDVGFPIASNVLALILWPRLPVVQDPEGNDLSANFAYNSRQGSAIQKAQLPPSVQVTMIVMDEASASRLASGSAAPTAITSAFTNRFQDVTRFESDLEAVRAALTAAKVNHLVLSSSVTLREAKWSQTP